MLCLLVLYSRIVRLHHENIQDLLHGVQIGESVARGGALRADVFERLASVESDDLVGLRGVEAVDDDLDGGWIPLSDVGVWNDGTTRAGDVAEPPRIEGLSVDFPWVRYILYEAQNPRRYWIEEDDGEEEKKENHIKEEEKKGYQQEKGEEKEEAS